MTDEVDAKGRPVRVTWRSFARHIGVPIPTLRRWVDRSIADDVGAVSDLMSNPEVRRAHFDAVMAQRREQRAARKGA